MPTLSDNVDVFIQKYLDSVWSLELTPNDIRLETIAVKFDLSKRTLQRRLGEKGTSFASLLDEARKRRALKIIDNGGYSPADLAKILGFSDISGFHLAFKRWFGVSLRQHRVNKNRKSSLAKNDRFYVNAVYQD